MVQCSNIFVGILNTITLIVSILILAIGLRTWITNEATTECERMLEKLIIPFGVFLLVVSLIGLIGSCSPNTWFLDFYLIILAFLFFALISPLFFYSNHVDFKGIEPWLQKKINNNNNWSTIKSCLQHRQFCSNFHANHFNDTLDKFYTINLSDFKNGCCKPSNDCDFIYQNLTTWTITANVTYTNPACDAWNDDPNVLCFECQSCKDGLLQNLETSWKRLPDVMIILMMFMYMVVAVGCSASRGKKTNERKTEDSNIDPPA